MIDATPQPAESDTEQSPDAAPSALPLTSVQQIFAEMAQQSRTLEACIATNKARLFPLLAAARIVEVEVFYCGEGDSGGIDEINCRDAGNAPVELPEQTVTFQSTDWKGDKISEQECKLTDAIESFALDVIECRFAGWENNEGASGQILFHIRENTIELEHGTKSIHYQYAEF